MNFLQICPRFERAYVEEYWRDLYFYFPIKILMKRGHKATIYTHREKGQTRTEYFGFPLYRFDFINIHSRAFSPKLVTQALTKNFDLIHVHSYGNMSGEALNVLSRKPIVFTPHISDCPKHFYARKVFNAADKIIALSEYGKRLMTRNLKIPGEKIEVIPCPIDYGYYGKKIGAKDFSKNYGRSYYEYLIITVSTFKPVKRHDLIIKSIPFIKTKNVRFVFVGGDFEYQNEERTQKKIMDLVKKYNLSKKVIFTGFIPYEELRAALSSADIFVLLTTKEGQCLAMCEAIINGLPVITSNIELFDEIVYKEAIRIDIFENEEKIIKNTAEKIDELLNDEKRRRLMINKAKKHGLMFSSELIEKKMINLYYNLLEK